MRNFQWFWLHFDRKLEVSVFQMMWLLDPVCGYFGRRQNRLCAKLIILWCCGAKAQFSKLIKQMSLEVGKIASGASRVEFHAEGGWARVWVHEHHRDLALHNNNSIPPDSSSCLPPWNTPARIKWNYISPTSSRPMTVGILYWANIGEMAKQSEIEHRWRASKQESGENSLGQLDRMIK